MRKEVLFSSKIERDGRTYRQVYPVRPGGGTLLQKCAEFNDLDQEMKAFIAGISPDPSFIYVVAVALGAGESWSSNVNGDWFSRADLIKNHHTFVENGKVFHLHDNSPSSKSYGSILYSRFNDKMDRVELVFSIRRADLPEIVARIEKGDCLDVSMGTKVDFDVCSICNKKSRRFSDYCEHLKYEMHKIYPDGRKVMALNPDPRFFDISLVDIGADRVAKILAKVASKTKVVHSAALAEKISTEKESLLDKGHSQENTVIKGLPEALKIYWQRLGHDLERSAEDIDIRGDFGTVSDILNSITCNGVMLRPHEFISGLLDRLGLNGAANEVFANKIVFSDACDLGGLPAISEVSGSLPIPIPNYYFASRKLSPGSLATRTKLVMVKSSRPYKILQAKNAREKGISGLYKSYVKTAVDSMLGDTVSGIAPVLPALLATFIVAKVVSDSLAAGSPLPSPLAADTVYLGASDVFGVPVGEVISELGVTPSEMKRSVKEELVNIEKLMRSGDNRKPQLMFKMSSAHVVPLQILSTAVSYMKLAGAHSDEDALRRLNIRSPATAALAIMFPRSRDIADNDSVV